MVFTLLIVAGAALLQGCSDWNTRVIWRPGRHAVNNTVQTFERAVPHSLMGAVVEPQGAIVGIGLSGTIMRSLDGGASWEKVPSGTESDLQSVVIEPRGTVIAVGDRGTVVRSLDRGASWEKVPSGTNNALLRVVVASDGAVIAFGMSGAIVRSVDRGSTWHAVRSGTTSDLVGALVEPNGSIIAVGMGGTITRSRDHGKSWEKVRSNSDSNLLLAVVAPGGSLIAFGQNGAIVRSLNSGVSWESIRSGIESALISAAVDSNGTVFAVGQKGAILRSIDRGASWEQLNSQTDSDFLSVSVARSGAVIAVGRGGMISLSSDRGDTWTKVQSGTELDIFEAMSDPRGPVLAFGSGGTIIRSVDGCVTWSVVRRFTDQVLARIASDSDGAMIAIGGGGTIVRSLNRGVDWDLVRSNGAKDNLRGVVAHRSGIIVAVGDHGMILRSSDHGASWQPVASGTHFTLQEVVEEPKGALLAVGDQGTILRSADDGSTWVSVGSPTENNLGRVVSETQGALIAFGTDGTIVRSLDHGASWERVSSGTESNLTAAIVGPNAAIAFSWNGDIIRSADHGASWTLVNRNAPKKVLLLGAVAKPNGTVIAFGPRGAILRSLDSGASWAAVKSGTESDLLGAVVDPSGALTVVGSQGTVVRSTDGGASWALARDPTSSLDGDLLSALADRNGAVIAVGTNGAIFRSSEALQAPSIAKIVSTYSADGHPRLKLTVNDLARTCDESKSSCISIQVRSVAFERRKAQPIDLPADKIHRQSDTDVYADLDPTYLGAVAPDPLYARIRIKSPGYSHLYPEQDKSLQVENNPDPFWRRTWFIALMVLSSIFLGLLITLVFRPLWLLSLTDSPSAIDEFGKYIPGGGFASVTARVVLLPILVRHPRVLDAWVRQHADLLRRGFNTSVEVATGRVPPFCALPFDCPAELTNATAPAIRALLNKQRCCFQILGQGGSGKTRLAVEIGHWIFSGLLTRFPSAAVFIDEEFEDLRAVLHTKLRAMLPEASIPIDFVDGLLSKGRLCVLVDRVSERKETTRTALKWVYRKMSPRLMVFTTRYPIVVDGNSTVTLRTRSLNATTLLLFLAEQLRNAHAADLFPGLADQSALVQHLARQITIDGREDEVTPLLVTIFVSQAIETARTRGANAVDELPANIPDAYFAYVEQLDRTKRSLEADALEFGDSLREAAALIAYLELGDDFRPKPVERAKTEAALKCDPRFAAARVPWVRRLQDDGLLVSRHVGAVEMIEYVFDPLAECLAAFEHLRRCGVDRQEWIRLLQRVRAQGEATRGFMLALRMNYAAYATQLNVHPEIDFTDFEPEPSSRNTSIAESAAI